MHVPESEFPSESGEFPQAGLSMSSVGRPSKLRRRESWHALTGATVVTSQSVFPSMAEGHRSGVRARPFDLSTIETDLRKDRESASGSPSKSSWRTFGSPLRQVLLTIGRSLPAEANALCCPARPNSPARGSDNTSIKASSGQQVSRQDGEARHLGASVVSVRRLDVRGRPPQTRPGRPIRGQSPRFLILWWKFGFELTMGRPMRRPPHPGSECHQAPARSNAFDRRSAAPTGASCHTQAPGLSSN